MTSPASRGAAHADVATSERAAQREKESRVGVMNGPLRAHDRAHCAAGYHACPGAQRRWPALPTLVLACLLASVVPTEGKSQTRDLLGEVQALQTAIDARSTPSVQDVAVVLDDLYASVYAVNPDDAQAAFVEGDPAELARALHGATLAVDGRMRALYAQGRFSEALSASSHRAVRAMRQLREKAMRKAGAGAFVTSPLPGEDEIQRYSWVGSDAPLPATFFLANAWPDPVCAAITRATERFHAFCHFAIAFRTESDLRVGRETYPAGSLLTVEAGADRGILVWPLASHLRGASGLGTVREAIFVIADPALQPAVDRARRALVARVVDALNAGRPLGYDFTMGTGGRGDADISAIEMDYHFCSGLGEVIGEEIGQPFFTYPSRFAELTRPPDLLEMWGIDRNHTVAAPGDVDHTVALRRFAEGVDLGRMEELHRLQEVGGSLVRWTREGSHGVHVPGWLRSSIGLVTGIHDLLRLNLLPKIPAPVMASFVPVILTANRYTAWLDEEAAAFEARYDRPMLRREMAERLLETRDELDTAPWFVPLPALAGRYELAVTDGLFGERPRIELEVTELDATSLRVERTQSDLRGGRRTATGFARPFWDRFDAHLVADDGTRLAIRYRVSIDGAIRGRPLAVPPSGLGHGRVAPRGRLADRQAAERGRRVGPAAVP